jgi:hypothetical protein
MRHLLDDPNVRIRLVAARAVLEQTPGDPQALDTVRLASDDPAPRVRQACQELITLFSVPVSEKLSGGEEIAVTGAGNSFKELVPRPD